MPQPSSPSFLLLCCVRLPSSVLRPCRGRYYGVCFVLAHIAVQTLPSQVPAPASTVELAIPEVVSYVPTSLCHKRQKQIVLFGWLPEFDPKQQLGRLNGHLYQNKRLSFVTV